MLRLTIEDHSEWHAGELRVALDEAAPAKDGSRKGQGGQPLSDDWLAVMVEVGAWLERDGLPPQPQQTNVVNYIFERFKARRLPEPSRSHAHERAKLALGAFRSWRRESGN
jgi:hypothetical protein